MELGKKLSEIRKTAQLSQAQLVALLRERGFDIKTYTVCKWENGTSNPSVEAFLAVCDICRVEDIRRTFVGKRLLRLYDIPVSAGHGSFLEESDYEMIEVDPLVPKHADYAVRVRGDSMTPRYVDRQIIFVHEQPTLCEGEIGIFYLNHEVYLKKLGSGCLLSVNPAYAPIAFGENDVFRVFGKVVG